MTSIVRSILSSTVGLLWNKARNSTAAKLKDGDVRELNDIKTKPDGLSREDLLSGYCFLKEGLDLLLVSLDKSKLEQKAVIDPTQQDRGETSRLSSDFESGILSEALELSHELKIYCDEESESAKERFKEARNRATDAFCNEALTINDRIFAAKIRIFSEIMECLDSPQTAITGCLSFLQELHSLPAIRQIFSVYFSGGIKSVFRSEERVEVVKFVMLINYVLYDYNVKFSNRELTRIWSATIELDDGRSFNPILDWREVATRKSMGDELSRLRDPYKLMVDEKVIPVLSAVNNRKLVVVEKKVDEALRSVLHLAP
jgi:hypothetical protein